MVRVAHTDLRAFATECYRTMNLPDETAAILADTLVQADLWGHPSHGVMRLFWYAARFQSGATDATVEPEPEVTGALSTMDGKNGVGQLIAHRAMGHAISLAKSHGIGAVAVRNSGHFGTAMYFTKMAADAGCVGFLSTNASPAMAPWGGMEKRVGTNPWSWAAPAGAFPTMMLDIANTAVARGKLYVAKQRGVPIPETWAIDQSGNPTTDPAAGIAGTILPMAGHKGYAISALIDVLSGVLTGSSFGREIVGPYEAQGKSGVGHLAIAIDIEAARGLSAFETDMESLISDLKSVPRQPGVDEVFYPGELEARSDAKLRKEGIDLPQATADDLTEKAAALGVAPIFRARGLARIRLHQKKRFRTEALCVYVSALAAILSRSCLNECSRTSWHQFLDKTRSSRPHSPFGRARYPAHKWYRVRACDDPRKRDVQSGTATAVWRKQSGQHPDRADRRAQGRD